MLIRALRDAVHALQGGGSLALSSNGDLRLKDVLLFALSISIIGVGVVAEFAEEFQVLLVHFDRALDQIIIGQRNSRRYGQLQPRVLNLRASGCRLTLRLRTP